MNFLELKLIRRLATGIVSFTSFLVLVLGFWLWGTVTAAPDRVSLHQLSLSSSTDLSSVSGDLKRSPSSIQSVSLVAPSSAGILNRASTDESLRVNSKIETLTLDCLKDGERLKKTSGARQVRLKTGLCLGQKAVLEKSNIFNRANGFEATLFQLEQGGFSSDYINLVDGENQIIMQVKDAKGRTVSAEVTISRQSKF